MTTALVGAALLVPGLLLIRRLEATRGARTTRGREATQAVASFMVATGIVVLLLACWLASPDGT